MRTSKVQFVIRNVGDMVEIHWTEKDYHDEWTMTDDEAYDLMFALREYFQNV